jgi:hypothetical protein
MASGDDSAVRVRGAETDVVSGGQWLLLNAPAAESAASQSAGQDGQLRGQAGGTSGRWS